MTALDEAVALFLEIEGHRAECWQCLPATEAWLRDEISDEEMNARICSAAREMFDRYGKLGPRVVAERRAAT